MQGSSSYFLITVDVGLSYSRIMQSSSRYFFNYSGCRAILQQNNARQCSRYFLITVDVGLSYSRIMQGSSKYFFNYSGCRAILQQNNARQL